MNIRKLSSLLCIAATIFAASRARSQTPAQTATSARDSIVPLVDHHQHLSSPMDRLASAPPAQPEIALPAGLTTLLKQRAEFWEKPEAMREIFTNDAVVLDQRFPKWVVGPEPSAYTLGWLAFPPYTPYVLRPVAYHVAGNVARIQGLYMDAAEKDAIIGYFSMDAEKGRDGKWRIAAETPSFPYRRSANETATLDAAQLIAFLDKAGIRKAVILSNATWYDGLVTVPGDEYANVRAENDWTADQVKRYPDRLVAFCGFNPWKDHALTELERCSKNSAFRGVKLHFGNSPVDLDNPRQVAKVRRVFEAANRLRWPLVVHLAATPNWGARQAAIFLNQLVAAAPDVPVVVAHLWGGAFYNEPVLAFFANAVSSGNPAAKNLYFDVAQLPLTAGGKGRYEQIVKYMRQIGLNRIYYGSDGPNPPGLPPKEMWDLFRKNVPLIDDELRVLANNVAPWAR